MNPVLLKKKNRTRRRRTQTIHIFYMEHARKKEKMHAESICETLCLWKKNPVLLKKESMNKKKEKICMQKVFQLYYTNVVHNYFSLQLHISNPPTVSLQFGYTTPS
jgi:hypothetical protein